MMQKEQRLLQPSWTFKLGRVFSRDVIAGEDRSCNQFGVGKDVADQSESRRGKRNGFQETKSRDVCEVAISATRCL